MTDPTKKQMLQVIRILYTNATDRLAYLRDKQFESDMDYTNNIQMQNLRGMMNCLRNEAESLGEKL